MSRTIPAPLAPLLQKQVTAIGYFVAIANGAQVIRICDIGTYELAGETFAEYDVTVEGVGETSIRLIIQNVDNLIGGLALSADSLPDLEVTVWQFERGDPTAVVMLGQYVPARATVRLDACMFDLRRTAVSVRFAPARRINERGGLHYAPQASEFVFAGTRVVIQERD
jgi:hypothetical protein